MLPLSLVGVRGLLASSVATRGISRASFPVAVLSRALLDDEPEPRPGAPVSHSIAVL